MILERSTTKAILPIEEIRLGAKPQPWPPDFRPEWRLVSSEAVQMDNDVVFFWFWELST